MRRFIPVLAAAFAIAFFLSACSNRADAGSTAPTSQAPYTPPSAPPSNASPTPPATPSGPLPKSGVATDSCLHGWVSPKPGSESFKQALKVIENTDPVKGKLVVVEMRYFVGPESPPSDKAESRRVARWYVKAYAARDIRYQGRFLVESRVFGSGVAAVAPYDTTGFKSPDWTGFQWNAADPVPRSYPGLPGRWAGIPYNFVAGGQGLTIPGLPKEVTGCLDGT
jgi:hypothetical protein